MNFLKFLLVKDDAVRRQSEEYLAHLKESCPDELVCGLCTTIYQDQDDRSDAKHLKDLSAVLLRQFVLYEEDSVYTRLSLDGKVRLQSDLIRILRDNDDRKLRKKVAEVAGELAGLILQDRNWEEFMHLLNDLLQSNSPKHIESGLQMLGMICSACPFSNSAYTFGESDFNYLMFINNSIQSLLLFSSHDDPIGEVIVRESACRFLATIVCSLNSENDMEHFTCHLRTLLESTESIFLRLPDQIDCFSSLRAVFEVWTDIACQFSKLPAGFYFKKYMTEFTAFCVEILSLNTIENDSENLRHEITQLQKLCLEFLVTCAEEHPSDVRKLEKKKSKSSDALSFCELVLPICFQWMMTLDHDDAHWHPGSEFEDNDDALFVNDPACLIGQQAWERIIKALKCRCCLPVAQQIICTHLQSIDNVHEWNASCYCSLVACSLLMEPLKDHDDAESIVNGIFDLIVPLLEFNESAVPHARLRWAVMQLVSGMCQHHGPDFQMEHGEVVLNAIGQILQSFDESPSNLVFVSLTCLICFLDMCPPGNVILHDQIVVEIAQTIMSVLEAKSSCPQVSDAAIGALGSLIENAPSSSITETGLYAEVMPVLKRVLIDSVCSLCNTEGRISRGEIESLKKLSGKLMECVSIVGQSVDAALFKEDGIEVLNCFVESGLLASVMLLSDDDHLLPRSQLLKSVVRMGKKLSVDFVDYLSYVMPPLMEGIKRNVFVEKENGNNGRDDDQEEEEADEDVDYVETADGKRIAVSTFASEDQSTACQMIIFLAESLQELFFPYVEDCLSFMLPLVDTSVHEEVRMFVMASIPELLRSVAKHSCGESHGQEFLYQIFCQCIKRLTDAMKSEGSIDLILTGLQSMKLSIEYVCVNWEQHATGMKNPVSVTPKTSLSLLHVFSADGDMLDVISSTLLELVGDSIQRRAVLRAQNAVREDELDEEDEDEEADGMENETQVLFNVSECIGCLIRTHGAAFLPYYANIFHQKLLEMTHPICLVSDKRMAVFVMDDIVEYCEESGDCVDILPSILCKLIVGCNDDDPGVRQGCVYGLGVAAKNHPSIMHSFSVDAAKALTDSILVEDQDEGTNQRMANDNSIASLAILCEVYSKDVDAVELWPIILDHMPLSYDPQENKQLVGLVCRLLRKFDECLLSAIMCNGFDGIDGICSILSNVCCMDAVKQDEEVINEVVSTLRELHECSERLVNEETARHFKKSIEKALGEIESCDRKLVSQEIEIEDVVISNKSVRKKRRQKRVS